MKICLVPRGKCLGGLGNSFGIFNALLHFTMTHHAGEFELVWPRNLCHGIGRLFGSSVESRATTTFTEGNVGSVVGCDASRFTPVAELCGSSYALPWGEFGDSPMKASAAIGHELWCNALSFTTEGEGSEVGGGKHGARCRPEHLALYASSSGASSGARTRRHRSLAVPDHLFQTDDTSSASAASATGGGGGAGRGGSLKKISKRLKSKFKATSEATAADTALTASSRGGRGAGVSSVAGVALAQLPSQLPAPSCGSAVGVDIDQVLWHYNASVTRPKLQDLYYSSFHNTYQSPKMMALLSTDPLNRNKVVVAVHVRLGGSPSMRFSKVGPGTESLKNTSNQSFKEKWMSPSWLLFSLRLVASAVQQHKCLKVHLFTDITHFIKEGDNKAKLKSHPDIAPVLAAFPTLEIQVHGSEMAEGFAFQAQVWANVLVTSSSGFSRMAAVLSRNTVLAPRLLSHPLHDLDHVVSVYHKDFWDRRDVSVGEEGRGVAGRSVLAIEAQLGPSVMAKLRADLKADLQRQFSAREGLTAREGGGNNLARLQCVRA